MTPQVVNAMKQNLKGLNKWKVLDHVLGIRDTAPAFSLPNRDDRLIHSRDLLHQGPLVVLFYRGKWCPSRNAALVALRQSYPQMEAPGASMVAISPQLQQFSKELDPTQTAL